MGERLTQASGARGSSFLRKLQTAESQTHTWRSELGGRSEHPV